jgi:carbonic anhydrase
MKTVERFLLENKAWAEDKIIGEPRLFERLADTQTPEVLWIGCSGSRGAA